MCHFSESSFVTENIQRKSLDLGQNAQFPNRTTATKRLINLTNNNWKICLFVLKKLYNLSIKDQKGKSLHDSLAPIRIF